MKKIMVKQSRRNFISTSGMAILGTCCIPKSLFSLDSNRRHVETFPPWRKGFLDIHHINTGKGNSIFFIFPDGTTFLLDAGAVERKNKPLHYDSGQVPNTSKRPGEWIANYIQNFHPEREKGGIDCAMITHFHGDHMGTVTNSSPAAINKPYKLTGITDVGDVISIRKMIDRGWPDYNQPPSLLNNSMLINYKKFLKWQQENGGMKVERFAVGKNNQIVLENEPLKYPHFCIQNIASNGLVWTGERNKIRNRFPLGDFPNENNSSCVMRLTYGNFTYYTGGDIAGTVGANTPEWHDMESAIASIVGPVDVHVANHHAFKNTGNPFFLSELRPRVHVILDWGSSQPDYDVTKRMLSRRIYPGDRDIYLLNGVWKGRKENMLRLFGEEKTNWLINQIKKTASSQGHIVIRVKPGGERYSVFMLSDSDIGFPVKSVKEYNSTRKD